jgi:hypothetical protein
MKLLLLMTGLVRKRKKLFIDLCSHLGIRFIVFGKKIAGSERQGLEIRP